VVNIGAGTFIVGMTINDFMALMTLVTFLFILVTPFYNAYLTGKDMNPLDYPGDTVKALNSLWFQDFVFFGNKAEHSCIGSVYNFGNVNSPLSTNLSKTVVVNVTCPFPERPPATNAESCACFPGSEACIGLGFTFDVFRTAVNSIPVIGPAIWFVLNLIFSLFFLLTDCGLSGVRLAIGCSIVVYWFFKAVLPLLELGLKLIG